MMKQKGKLLYVPSGILEEISDIKREDKLTSNADAFREMVKYTRVARELKRMMNLDWRKKARRTPVDNLNFKKPKWKKNKNDKPLFDF